LTIANALLGFSQASLAKYLLIAAREDDASLDTSNIESFLRHMLERVDFERDLHFQTRTTIDTLDYSGSGLNTGSKLVIAAAGEKKRELDTTLPAKLNLPGEFRNPRMALPGVLVLEAPASLEEEDAREQASALAAQLDETRISDGIALVVLTEDSEFCARNTRNFLWVTFTRSNPSHDLHGAGSFIEHKHWGCRGPIVIDARIKSHHAPPLIEDPAVSRRVDELAARGGPLHGII
jgi:4-hydroxy-3-polyprenylbenzoate decarboxylase